jgi:hypothetical protein
MSEPVAALLDYSPRGSSWDAMMMSCAVKLFAVWGAFSYQLPKNAEAYWFVASQRL